MVRRSGRKSQARSDETRAQILSAALTLFREKGFEGTTMRDIAERSGIAVGASYYYFRSKEELIFVQYLRMQEESEADAELAIAASKKFERRLKHIIDFKFEQLAKDRELIRVLGRIAADPTSDLSPFSAKSEAIRKRAITMMERLCDGTGLKVAKSLLPHLPFLLWVYYLMLIFLWAHDPSAEQRLTRTFAALSLPLLVKLLSATNLPLTGGITASVVKLTAVMKEFCGEADASLATEEG